MPNQDIDSIAGLAPYRIWNAGAPVGTPVVVTYSFPTQQADYDFESREDFTAFSTTQQGYIRQALDVWDASSGISFVEVAPDQGDIRFALIDFGGRTNSEGNPSSGFAYYPSVSTDFSGTEPQTYLRHDTIGGDVFMNVDLFSADSSMAPGVRGFSLMLHELGHALGLQHSFEGDVAIDPARDSGVFTVMSYNRSRQTTELGSIDVEAMRFLYGETDPDVSYDAAAGVISITGGAAGDWLLGGWSGSNDLSGGAGDDTLVGFDGDDTLRPGTGDDVLEAGGGDDVLLWDEGANSYDGDGGTDLLLADLTGMTGMFSADLNIGLAGMTDGAASTLARIEQLHVTGAVDASLTGGYYSDILTSDAGNDTLTGGVGNDTLTAGAGNDVLEGGSGNNLLFGGAGQDEALYTINRSDAIVVALPDGGLELGHFSNVADRLYDIETVTFGDGSVSMALLISGSLGPGQTITGTPDPDLLNGSDLDDTISGGANGDTIQGGTGTDLLMGGIGFDLIHGQDGADTLIGADGYDTLQGGHGNDSLTGNNGFDSLEGGTGQDTLLGGLGLDTLFGGEGDDLLSGQSGFDAVDGQAGNDTVNGNAGADTVSGGDGDDLLNGGINNDLLIGGAGNDTLNGNNGSDTLTGGEGDDRVEGNAGNDQLSGHFGDDVLRGGIGADTFLFGVGFGADRVADFQNNIDDIMLEQGLFSETSPVPEDLRDYASLNADGFVVLTFATGDSLTFTGVTNTTALLDDVVIG